MNYTIIEDCSPYYIRFTFDGLHDIIEYVKSQPTKLTRQAPGYSHEDYSIDAAEKIISMLPMAKLMKFKNHRVALFNTPPYGGCGIHKDGGHAKISLNIPIEVVDDLCLTHWYTDEEVKHLPVDTLGGYSNNVWKDWKNLDQFTPVKSITAKPGEMILFNTDIYHCWSNKDSQNSRKILTLRTVDTSMYFNEMRKLIFGF